MWNRGFKVVCVILGIGFGIDLISRFVAESFWFDEVGYLSVFWTRISVSAIVGTIGTIASLGFLIGNLAIAQKRRLTTDSVTDRAEYPLSILLLTAIVLAFVVGLVLLQAGSQAIAIWQSDPTPVNSFHLRSINQISLIGALGFAIVLLIRSRILLGVGAIGLSLVFGFILSQHWSSVLQLLHATAFGRTDPVFDRDISFYIFVLPNLELLEFWLAGLTLYSFASVCLTYLLSGNSLSEGRFPGFTRLQQQHLLWLAACLLLTIAFSCWISRYELLYSTRGVAYGASYTDIQIQLPIKTALSLSAIVGALYCFWRALNFKKKTPVLKPLLIYGAIATVSITVPALFVQRFIVQPNELTRERPFIERSIAQTREAFNLTAIDTETFDPKNTLTVADLQKNDRTVRNIRLWDTRPLLQTNRQLQQIRPYYAFYGADIDRYTLAKRSTEGADKQQVLISARELDYNGVPAAAKTWINEHLVYTHGYGFTLSPVNQVAAGGLPNYFVKDITSGSTPLNLSSNEIRNSIPIDNPRIYYGELANTYIMTATKVKEFDYPSETESVYTTYDGRGGISIAAKWRQLLFAKYLNDWQMLFTRNFTDRTKLLFRRNITDRISAIAPFLHYDSDPYLVVADAGESTYLYWIIDAYTVSDRYPYSDPGKAKFNYIRNSVKVVVDAYHGSVNFYVADAQDPIGQTWRSIFPTLFKPLSAMPPALQSHLRYPIDLFRQQSDRLLIYHMTDPQVFYNREDQWQVPNEIYGNKPQQVEPYYAITKLPTATSEEFILLLPYTPNQRTNLIAWLAARSDAQNYGKLLLYTFPKQELVFGTEQIEARINQDPIISQQITLWNREGSRVIQGNLLVIPIEQSLLYVEPIYLEAEQNSLPTLVRVVVAYENRIAMAETLDQALKAVFQPQKAAPTIVRPVESR